MTRDEVTADRNCIRLVVPFMVEDILASPLLLLLLWLVLTWSLLLDNNRIVVVEDDDDGDTEWWVLLAVIVVILLLVKVLANVVPIFVGVNPQHNEQVTVAKNKQVKPRRIYVIISWGIK